MRHSPSKDPLIPGETPRGSNSQSLLSRVVQSGVMRKAEDKSADANQVQDGHSGVHAPRRSTGTQSPALMRSRSAQSIGENEIGITPPLSCRGTRLQEPPSARRNAGASYSAPTASPNSRSPMQTPPHPKHNASGPTRLTRFAVPPTADLGGTPSGSAPRRTQQVRPAVNVPSRGLAPSASALTLRNSDAGSGGTGGDNISISHHTTWSLATSRSTPHLDMRLVTTRGRGQYTAREHVHYSQDTPNATARPLASARSSR